VTQELARAGLTVAPAGMAGRLVLLEARKPWRAAWRAPASREALARLGTPPRAFAALGLREVVFARRL